MQDDKVESHPAPHDISGFTIHNHGLVYETGNWEK